MLNNQNDIKKILLQLEEAVNKDEKKKLYESDILHVALETWENVHKTSEEWGVPPGVLLKAAAIGILGVSIVEIFDLGKVWKKIVNFSVDKAKKLLQAAKIINVADNAQDAIRDLKAKLGLNIQPNLNAAMRGSKAI